MSKGLSDGGFDHDFEKNKPHQDSVAALLGIKRVEIKNDRIAAESGNLFVEFYHLNQDGTLKPSGMNTTTADYWAFRYLMEPDEIKADDPKRGNVLLIPTADLRALCEEKDPRTGREIYLLAKGGDNDRQLGVLLPMKRLIPHPQNGPNGAKVR